MSNIVDFAKQALGLADPNAAEAKRLVTAYTHEAAALPSIVNSELPTFQAVLSSEPEMQVAVLDSLSDGTRNYNLLPLKQKLLSRNLPLSEENYERLLKDAASTDYYFGQWSGVLRAIKRYVDSGGNLTPTMQTSLDQMYGGTSHYYTAELRKLKTQIDELLGRSLQQLPDAGEAWADAVRAELETVGPEPRAAWMAIFAYAMTAETGKPSAKWLTAARKNRQTVGMGDFVQHVSRWLALTCAPVFSGVAPKEPGATDLLVDPRAYDKYLRVQREYRETVQQHQNNISEKNISLLKGLAWYAAVSDDAGLARSLAHMAEMSFQRTGWASRAGNAAIWALGQMPGGVGVGPLARLRTRLRDRGALKLIAGSIEAAAENAGMTVDELEDLALPIGGLDTDGARRENFSMDGLAVLTLDPKNAKTNLQWFGADGKPRKAVPVAVKSNYAAEVKALKAAEEEIKGALTAQAARFDKFLLDEREWTHAQWKERYLAHPILGNISRRLIWTVDGLPALPDDLPDHLSDATPVRLWHPLGATPDDVLRWRQRLEIEQIVQPFKQAHREVYLLTDAERNTRTYSNRFAAHILKQHQFNSLCVLRGWKNKLRLMVDDFYPPAARDLPRHNLRAEFWVEGIGDDYGTDTNDVGTYLRLVTDQVRFYRLDAATNHAHAGGGGYAGANWRQAPAEALPLDQIPPLVFSEVMRDVDLFVGVASVGNDPTWADGGPQGRFRNYWQDYSFGELTETATTRADVLARLLPRLKIASRCRLDGRFLLVRGDLRSYKIHLGSGNILMEPNDQYLCIVPTSRSEDSGDLFLPFAGDRTLAVVLSKAFLLADDTRIADPTITRQIKV